MARERSTLTLEPDVIKELYGFAGVLWTWSQPYTCGVTDKESSGALVSNATLLAVHQFVLLPGVKNSVG